MPRVSLKALQARLRQPTAIVNVGSMVATIQSQPSPVNTATGDALLALQDSLNSIEARIRSLADPSGADNRWVIDGSHIQNIDIENFTGTLTIDQIENLEDFNIGNFSGTLNVTTQIADGDIPDGKISGIHGSKITGGTIEANKFSVKQLLIPDLTLTNNSPGAGSIAWSACTCYWNGTGYSISGGNTSLKFVYWDAGAGSFTAANSYTPQPNRFLIATNNSGTADEAWNKLARSAVQENNLAFSLLQGFTIRPIASVVLANSGAGNTEATVINTSSARGGALLAVGVSVASGTPSGRRFYIEYTIDGGTPTSIDMFDTISTGFSAFASSVAASLRGVGTAVGDSMSVYIGVGFESSLLVKVKAISDGTPAAVVAVGMFATRN